MKINILLTVIFLSVLVYASADFITGFVGATQLNGEGCACHSLTASPSVNVWIEGPDSVAQGETVQYRVFLSGGPAVLGGFNAAVRFNDISPGDTSMVEIDHELTHNSPLSFPFVTDTISWLFNFTANVQGWDTLYSVGNSVNGNGTPENDMWNFGPKFPVFVTLPVPVELISFSGKYENSGILLKWITASEINNKGFEVERAPSKSPPKGETSGKWEKIAFVSGSGTTTETKSYSFVDRKVEPGVYNYRLKQIDFDGSFEYSDIVSVDFTIKSFLLSQNYPNPFNPETVISFIIPEEGLLTLSIYNVQGEQVEVLSDGYISAGNHAIKWNASPFSSGVYFYKLDFISKEGLEFSEAKKMVLAK